MVRDAAAIIQGARVKMRRTARSIHFSPFSRFFGVWLGFYVGSYGEE